MQTHKTSPFTPPQQALLLSLSRGTTRTAACHAARTARRTLQRWIEQDPAFADAIEAAEAAAIAVAEDLAFACAMKAGEDPRYLRALFFWLRHRAGWVQARPEPAAPAVGGSGPLALKTPSPTENPGEGVPSVPSTLKPPYPHTEPGHPSSIPPTSIAFRQSPVPSTF